MARVDLVERRDQLGPEHHAVWDLIARSRGQVAGPFAVLLHSPPIARGTAELGAYIRFESGLEARDRELAVLTVARELDCGYEWVAHAREARRAGVREEAITAIREGKAPTGLTSEEAQIVEYVRQLLRAHRVDAATFDALRARLGLERLVELTATAGYYGMIAATLNAFEVVPPEGDDLLPV